MKQTKTPEEAPDLLEMIKTRPIHRSLGVEKLLTRNAIGLHRDLWVRRARRACAPDLPQGGIPGWLHEWGLRSEE